MSAPDITENTLVQTCSKKRSTIAMIIALVLLSAYFVFDVYNKVTIGLVQYNQQRGYTTGQQDLVMQLFKELETKKCQPIPVNFESKSIEIIEATCVKMAEPTEKQK